MAVQARAHDSRRERARQIAFVLWVTLILNWSVAGLKVGLGWWTHSMVILADGVHSFADGASNIAGLIAIYISAHPANRRFPYGHHKFETMAAVAIAFFLLVVAVGIFKEALWGIIHPQQPQISGMVIALIGVTLAVNIFVVWYERKKSRELTSDLLESDSWHTLTDVFVTISVLVALVGIYFGVSKLDAVFSLGISVVITMTAFKILKSGMGVLLDKVVVPKDQIESLVRAVEGVKDCHEIRSRGRQDAVYVDLHVLVDSAMTVQDSHRLANIIERKIRESIHGVQDVVVHIEPHTHDHREIGDDHHA